MILITLEQMQRWTSTKSKLENFVTKLNGFQRLIMMKVASCMGPRSAPDISQFPNSEIPIEVMKHVTGNSLL